MIVSSVCLLEIWFNQNGIGMGSTYGDVISGSRVLEYDTECNSDQRTCVLSRQQDAAASLLSHDAGTILCSYCIRMICVIKE